jgi:nitric oxide dioxygenase
LIWTLEAGLGKAFTPPVRHAWVEAYTLLSGVMIDAANSAEVPA